MERKDIIWLILVSVIIVVIASFVIPIIINVPHPGVEPLPGQPGQINSPPPFRDQSGQNPNEPQQANPSQQLPPPPGQEEGKQLKSLISFINIGLIIPLFIIYAGIYRKMRSSFTLGLMTVIFALGMYAVTSNPLLVNLFGFRAGYIGLFQIIPDLCATVALISLTRISLE